MLRCFPIQEIVLIQTVMYINVSVNSSEVVMGLTHEKMNRPNKSDLESHSGGEGVLFHVEVTL